MAQMKKRRTPGPAKIILAGFLVYSAVTIVSLQTQIAEKQEQLNSLSMRIKEYETSNAELQEQMKAEVSDEDIGEVARTELNYAKPGERVFVDTSTRQ